MKGAANTLMNRLPGKKNYRDDQLERTRRVQKVGGSSLSVTLPKNWIEEINLKPGDILTFKEMSGGKLELSKETQVGVPPDEQKTVHIDMEGEEPHMLTRLIVGSYIAGHDNVIIRSREPFTDAQKEEASEAVRRVLGLSLVEQSANTMEFQNFIDPIKYRLDHILSRVIGVMNAEIEGCRKGLADNSKESVESVFALEDEVDSFYLLMIRQLLLSTDNYRLAKGLGIESHKFQMGYRLVIKDLEMIGDLIYNVSRELWSLIDTGLKLPDSVTRVVDDMLAKLNRFVLSSYEAFREQSLQEVNSVINDINSWLEEVSANEPLVTAAGDMKVATIVQKIMSSLVEATRLLIVVDEVAFNRSMERDKLIDNGDHINVNHRKR